MRHSLEGLDCLDRWGALIVGDRAAEAIAGLCALEPRHAGERQWQRKAH